MTPTGHPTTPTTQLQPGHRVYTKDLGETDFDIPLVARTRGTVRGIVREVRSVHGHVVRFTDGTKTRRLHGRTVWVVAP